MLFAMTYTARNPTEKKDKRSLNLFLHWKPPSGYVFKSHYALADGTGGIGIIESSSAEAILEAHSPWAPFFDFRIVPLVEIDKAVPIFQRVNEWRDSIG